MRMADYKYNDVIHRCFRCGYCKFPQDWSTVTNCPAYARFRMESYSAGGRLWLIRAWLTGELEWSEHLADIVYSCATCKNCVEKCPHSFSGELVDMVIAARTQMIETGKLPRTVTRFLDNVQQHGNPYGIASRKRAEWMAEMDLEPYQGQDYLFYVGCEGAYDNRAQKIARSVARLLQQAGISFGVLGNDEVSDGNEVEMMGEDGLLEELASKNIARFSERGVTRIITLSPHSYNVFKNRYPDFGGQYHVFHYSHMLLQAIQSGKLSPPERADQKITFHDPCFLGRWNQEYSTPRKIIRSIPGVQMIEMARNKAGALCCGGGAGNFLTDFLGGSEESPARIRIREACDTKADILAVTCPNCMTMLEDAVKVEGREKELQVLDIAELFIKEE